MKRTIILAIAVLGITAAFLLWRRPAPVPGVVVAPAVTNDAEPEFAFEPKSDSARQLAALRPARAPRNGTNGPASTNLLMLLLQGGDTPRITREQAEAFVAANGRRADSLLAAWRASGDTTFLREAMDTYPKDPSVAFMAWSRNGLVDEPGDTAAGKREWLEKFKQAAPDNALADYLSARAHLKAGDSETAIRELAAAGSKPWQDYVLQGIQSTEEAYRAAGFSEAEAKAIAMMGALLPQLSELRALGKGLNEIAATRRDAGDNASADAALQWSIQLGQRAEQEGSLTLIQQLVGIAIERDALMKFDANATIDGSGRTAQARIAELDAQRQQIKEVAKDSGNFMERLNEPELATYFDRLKMFGEQEAIKWAKGRVSSN